MKKLLLLGGSRYLIPVIKTCKRLGIYTITCDYLPDNIAHKYSDEYHNVSIIEKELVLELAQELKIDGIMSFACDPGVVTAAYVAEKMGLPFQGSYKANQILQDKGLFREFLMKNEFNCPHAKSYTNKTEALQDVDYFTWPVIVKPVDSAGSKGVTKVDKISELSAAIDIALAQSHSARFIIEDFLTFQGYHSSTDVFTVNGQVQFCTYSDQLFDPEADNPYTPALIIWPSSMKNEHQDYLTGEIQRLMTLLDMGTGIYNIETCVDTADNPYIMEVSCRGGGCKIAELQKMATGTDLIELEVLKAVGEPVAEVGTSQINGVWAEMVVHGEKNQIGVFKELLIDSEIQKKYIKVVDMTVKSGDYIEPFTGANKSLGDIFLRFDTREELDRVIGDSSKWLKIVTEEQLSCR